MHRSCSDVHNRYSQSARGKIRSESILFKAECMMSRLERLPTDSLQVFDFTIMHLLKDSPPSTPRKAVRNRSMPCNQNNHNSQES